MGYIVGRSPHLVLQCGWFLEDIKSLLYRHWVLDVQAFRGVDGEKHTTRYDHLCNDVVFVSSLARNYLFNPHAREKLSQDAVSLFRSLAQLGRTAADLDIPDPKADATTNEVIEQANIHVQAARPCLALIAAVNV